MLFSCKWQTKEVKKSKWSKGGNFARHQRGQPPTLWLVGCCCCCYSSLWEVICSSLGGLQLQPTASTQNTATNSNFSIWIQMPPSHSKPAVRFLLMIILTYSVHFVTILLSAQLTSPASGFLRSNTPWLTARTNWGKEKKKKQTHDW